LAGGVEGNTGTGTGTSPTPKPYVIKKEKKSLVNIVRNEKKLGCKYMNISYSNSMI
jgi:hypothetical protein